MKKDLKSSPILILLIKSLVLFALWYVGYELWLAPDKRLDIFLNDLVVQSSTFVLQKIGFAATFLENNIYIANKFTISVGTPCNGLVLFALFAGFVLVMPGNILHKLWFMPAGIVLIFCINVVRVVALAVNAQYSPTTFDFNHRYVYQIAVYLFIFLLWQFWVRRFSGLVATK